jgi:hypothetical protein
LISYETFALVKERIFCEEHGQIEVRGIAYPVAAWRVVDSHESLHRQRRRFRESHPNVTVDLDIDAMSDADRNEAATILRRALTLLAPESAPARPGQPLSKEDSTNIKEVRARGNAASALHAPDFRKEDRS